MKRLNRFSAFLITAVLLFFTAAPASAAETVSEPDYSALDYYLSSYDVQIDVSEDNVLNVTEKISAYFNVKSHGIYRYIPLTNEIVREDKSTGKTHARVKNVSVSDYCSKKREHGNYVIQIGSKNIEVTGRKDYTISYSYVMGRDIGNGFDELYYNIIGNGWKTTIQNVTFSINMPKEFDESKLGFSAGDYGASGVGDIEYSVNGNRITGKLTKPLAPNQALTVRLELPENYFRFNDTAFYTKLALQILIPVIVLLVVFILWLKYGKDRKIVKKPEFYPPDGMSSLDVAYWYKGYVEERDVVPLMIELANEGYIDIRQKRTGTPDYLIVKIKHYDGGDESKKTFFKGLFPDGCDAAAVKDLRESFYLYAVQIVENINTEENKNRVFSRNSLSMRIGCWAASVAGIIASILIGAQIIDGYERIAAAIIGIAVSLCAFGLSFFIRKRTKKGHEILQKIAGFKMFLETAEKERLEKLVYDNPSYYYDILPYAYVLGVSDVWTKNFEGIVTQAPDWYGNGASTNFISFYGVFSHIMHAASDTMTSASSGASGTGSGSLGGGGYSGGGFSGGGSGGGGGGRW